MPPMTEPSPEDQQLIDEFRPVVTAKFPHAQAILVDGGFYTIETGNGFSMGLGARPATAWRSAAQTLAQPD